ncbi:hypothetical protein RND81_14G114400 [Saponaria officinalis]|uniref:KIB1-4 beta-propeller domain-containing protein n=1 Tax=Saponaria officinalis TaxID=3572 RepID=A0AAW1GKY1_SAPOF
MFSSKRIPKLRIPAIVYPESRNPYSLPEGQIFSSSNRDVFYRSVPVSVSWSTSCDVCVKCSYGFHFRALTMQHFPWEKAAPAVYKPRFSLDYNSTKNWFPVDALRDGARFLGDNYSMYVIASQFPGCRPNSVYFTDDVQDADMKLLFSHQFTCHREIGIFHLDNNMIERIECPLPTASRLPPPIWINPTI